MSARFRQRVSKPIKIYLDDIRIPKQGIWTVVRTPEQFRDVISQAQQIDPSLSIMTWASVRAVTTS